MASRQTERARALGFSSYRAMLNARAQTLGFNNFSQQTRVRAAIRESGAAAPRGLTFAQARTIVPRFIGKERERTARVDSKRGLLGTLIRDTASGRTDINYELHGYSVSSHQIFTFPADNNDWNTDTFNRIRDALIERDNTKPRGVSAFVQGAIGGYFLEYGMDTPKDNYEWRSVGSMPVDVFYRRYTSPEDLAIELECDAVLDAQIIYIEYYSGQS